MLKNQFEEWLLGMKACPQRVAYARSSNVARIEREKGLDLDEVFIDASVWGDLLAQFDYPMASWKKRIRPAHGIVFGDKANWYNGTSTLRHALRLYGEFKRWSEGGDGATERPAALPAAPSACSPTAEVPAKPSRAERKKSGGQNKDEMEDSYELFCEDFNIEPYQLYEFGLKRSHFAPLEKVVDQWKSLKKALLTGSTPLAIRKFGRQVDNPFHGLYHHLFPKALILNDANGNNAPKKAIQDATGWKINKNIRNYEISHVFSATNNPLLFNALWNFFLCPRLIDPFTGHISKGRWPEEYQPLLKAHVFAMFSEVIDDYNRFIREQKVEEKIEAYVRALPEATTRKEQKARKNFLKYALQNWSELIP